MFCRCPNGFGGGENTQTCPVCLALPGALPVPNRVALEWTLKLGLALGCEIPERAVFARKNYFYPDSPKGYQISQYDLPSCINGKMLVPSVDGDHEIGIVRAHLEEDAAKMIHVGGRTGPDRRRGALARRLRPRRHAARGDRHRSRHPLLGGSTPFPPAPAADDRRARDLRCRDGEGNAARGRQRLGSPRRIDGAAYALRDQEHELVPLRRPGDRRRGGAPDRDLRGGRGGRPGDLRLRRRHRDPDRAPVEGGGRRLPLLPRAGSRSGRAVRGARRAPARGAARSCRRCGSAGSSASSTSSGRSCS